MTGHVKGLVLQLPTDRTLRKFARMPQLQTKLKQKQQLNLQQQQGNPTRRRWSQRADVYLLPSKGEHSKELDIAGQPIHCGDLCNPKLVENSTG